LQLIGCDQLSNRFAERPHWVDSGHPLKYERTTALGEFVRIR